MEMHDAITAALRNVATHGDTDIFPFPFENLLFQDHARSAQQHLDELHSNFSARLSTFPPQVIPALAQVGYAGFRWATLIDPIWNAYYLALVINIAGQIEAERIPESQLTVFSYRFKWQPPQAKLFRDSTWLDFRKHSIALSHSYSYVVQTDIADFYPRIYHHRLENALKRLPHPGDTPSRIMELLPKFGFAKNVSYGLPIGGPASRLLAELALNSVDKLLLRSGVRFCRYADDYSIFCESKSEAYRTLVFLAEKLANEGLTLQKKKTRILTADEFRQAASLIDPAGPETPRAADEQKLLHISLRYDPYSPHASEEYESLKDAISGVDVLGILGRELGKTTIDTAVSKQAILAILALTPAQQEQAIRSLLDPQNMLTLAPVFITVMRIVRNLYSTFAADFRREIDDLLCRLLDDNSPMLSVEVNLSYFIQALAGDQSDRKEAALIRLFDQSSNPLIRRLILLAMARWGCTYWLSDVKNRFGAMTTFERSAFILASYYLGDEGRHWRDHTKSSWSPQECLTRDWFSRRFQTNRSVPL